MADMHGLTIASSIISEAKHHGDVKSVTVEVGVLSPITAAELQNLIKGLTKWKTKVVETRAIVKCACGHTGGPKITARLHDIVLFECPKFRALPLVVEGDAIKLKKVEVR